MNLSILIARAVRGLAILTNNPLVGGSNLRLEQASILLDKLAFFIAHAEETREELVEFTFHIEQMVEENRGPTQTELGWLVVRSDDAHSRIQEAAKRVRDGAPPVPTEEPEEPEESAIPPSVN